MRRRSRLTSTLCSVLCLAVTASAVAALTTLDDAATVAEPAVRLSVPSGEPPDLAGRSLLVSDSAWLGMRTYGGIDSVQGFEHHLDLASCRRRVSRSCENYNGFVPVTALVEVGRADDRYDTLIMATGYNDSDHDFRDDVATIMQAARAEGFTRVVWLTLRSNVTYTSPGSAGFAEVFERNNLALREIVDADTYSELIIADWAAYSQDHPAWFSLDGIHLRNPGAFAAGDYISRKMAFLDGRPCAQPLRPGEPPQAPCPDPDATGAVADLRALYPIGEPWPRGTFVLEFEGVGSWPDPPWWER